MDRNARRAQFHTRRNQGGVADALAARAGDSNRVRGAVFDALSGRLGARTAGTIAGATDMLPIVGDVSGVEDTYQAARGGDYKGAAIAGAATILGLIPGVGDAASKLVRSAADGAGGAVRKGIRAYHGSPHDFDRFDLSKIGTGEGAQAYGHGLYFAENEGVAQSYKDLAQFSGATTASAKNMLSDEGLEVLNSRLSEAYEKMADEFGVSVDDIIDIDNGVTREQLEEQIFREGGRLVKSGRMYEVNINASPDDFLDWDKPLSEQPEAVRRVVDAERARMASRAPDDTNSLTGKLRRGEMTGADVASYFSGGSVRELREAGIPGIKYLDAGSRGAGDGSRNYVVFDDSLVEIIRKYGLAGLMAMGGLGALYGQPPAQEN